MKCPLRSALIELEGVTDFDNILPCLKEECAWWIDDIRMCSIRDLALETRWLQWQLQDVGAKMGGKT